MLKELLETPEQFMRWLASQPREMIVGRRGYVGDCPVARFTNQATGFVSKVSHDGVILGQPFVIKAIDSWFTYGDWRQKFVEAVDTYIILEDGDDPKSIIKDVTVAECLMHLGQLYPESVEQELELCIMY